ncbi:cytochrome P450 [Peniophora sp. CONT]|nr:cytochrome P450 [Peniophora sp. CONT]
MTYTPSLLDAVAIGVALYIAKRLFFQPKSSDLPLPPGPPGFPLIGNALDIPQMHPYRTYEEWGRKYGPIMHVSALGLPLIIVNDMGIATELLEKRAALYSDRHSLPMAGELAGWDSSTPLLCYGDRWRAQRRYFHTFIGARSALSRHDSLLEHEARLVVLRLMRTPWLLEESIRKAAGSMIMKITYGYDTLPEADPLIALVSEAMEHFSQISESSKVWLVDFFPKLKNVPSWLPGAGFRKIAAASAEMAQKMSGVPFDLVKKRMKDHNAEPCMLADLLEQAGGGADEERDIKWAATSMYGGGADTTSATMLNFFLSMTLFPESQKKAQAEIDAVVGRDRLPTLADRPNLPYVGALVQEIIRWAPVVPMGIPHKLIQDDVFGEYRLPQGSLILTNIYAMLHDPAVYANPDAFVPERFIENESASAEPDPRACFFGFGRRVCPGRHLADMNIWIMIAVALATLSVRKARDNVGTEITPEVRFVDGTINRPVAFKCDIQPRWPEVEALAAQELTQFHRDRD